MRRTPIVDFRTMERLLFRLGLELVHEIPREIELTPEQFRDAVEKL